VHVTLRVLAGVPQLRRGKLFRTIRSCIASCHKATFQVVEYCVMGNHLHLIVEASHRVALSRGMQGLKVRLARRLNGAIGRRGTVFAERYHARILTTPMEVRNALSYVLGNARRHARQHGRRLARGWVDPCSSAPYFDGWRGRKAAKWSRSVDPWERDTARENETPRATGPPTRPARTWVLSKGWRKHGLLDVNAVPGV
jgi:REP element-mobilizing transposase RayT